MAKGFKDSKGKFHPITEYKGVRKSRDQSAKSTGVQIERKARDHTSFCPVCKYDITRGSEQEVRMHIKEHIKLEEHREHTRQGIICDCGVRKARTQQYSLNFPYEGEVYFEGVGAPYVQRLPKHVVDRLNRMGGLYDGFVEMFNEQARMTIGGGFGNALRENNLRSAWWRADGQNRFNLLQLTGMDINEMNKFAYKTTHPDEQVNYVVDPKKYFNQFGVEDERRIK